MTIGRHSTRRGRRGLVDDDRRGGALPRGFLVFVGPAPVIGHRAAVERAVAPGGFPVGIVDEDDDGLPRHVDAGLIVPAALGRVDRSEEHTSELQSLLPISYAVFCLTKKHITQSNNRVTFYNTAFKTV